MRTRSGEESNSGTDDQCRQWHKAAQVGLHHHQRKMKVDVEMLSRLDVSIAIDSDGMCALFKRKCNGEILVAFAWPMDIPEDVWRDLEGKPSSSEACD